LQQSSFLKNAIDLYYWEPCVLSCWACCRRNVSVWHNWWHMTIRRFETHSAVAIRKRRIVKSAASQIIMANIFVKVTDGKSDW